MRTALVLLSCCFVLTEAGVTQSTAPRFCATPSEREANRVNHHKVTSRNSPAPEPGAENMPILSPLQRSDGTRVSNPVEWERERRPELLKLWMNILGKVAPTAEDKKWFPERPKAL